MSRVIRPESAARYRTKHLHLIARSLRAASSQSVSEADRKDLLAFIALTLEKVAQSVDETATAWERRGYWLKADRFRLEWSWAVEGRVELASALQKEDFDAAALAAARLVGKLSQVKVPKRMEEARPWQGAWQEWLKQSARLAGQS